MEAFAKFEHEGWQRVAGKYDSVWASSTRQFIPPLLDAAEVARAEPDLRIRAAGAVHRGSWAMIRTPTPWLVYGSFLFGLVFTIVPMPEMVSAARPFVLAMLALDLGVFHRKTHEVKLKEALTWSGVALAEQAARHRDDHARQHEEAHEQAHLRVAQREGGHQERGERGDGLELEAERRAREEDDAQHGPAEVRSGRGCTTRVSGRRQIDAGHGR